MGCMVVIAPLIIAGWPVITAAVTAAVGTLGFSVVKNQADENMSVVGRTSTHASTHVKAEMEVENSEVTQANTAALEQLVVERGGIRGTFSRDARGGLKLCMEGEGHSKAELQQMGKELIDRVTQQYVYHRIVTELKARNMNIVSEEITEDRTVKIRVRNQ
jgi:hypothetical protein